MNCNCICYIVNMASAVYTERIREARPKLSKSFKRLADYILDSYIQAALMTASELAHEVNVDAATVVRFAQALNYSGFPELQDEIKDRVLSDLHLDTKEEDDDNSVQAVMDSGFQGFAQSLERTRRLLDFQAAAQLAAKIQNSDTLIFLSPYRYRGHAQFFLDELGKFGLRSQFQPPEPIEIAKALAAASQDYFLLVLDLEGSSKIFAAALNQAEKFGLSTGALVGAPSFESARKAQTVLEIRAAEEGESEVLLMAAIFESLLNLLRLEIPDEINDYEKREKSSYKNLSSKT